MYQTPYFGSIISRFSNEVPSFSISYKYSLDQFWKVLSQLVVKWAFLAHFWKTTKIRSRSCAGPVLPYWQIGPPVVHPPNIRCRTGLPFPYTGPALNPDSIVFIEINHIWPISNTTKPPFSSFLARVSHQTILERKKGCIYDGEISRFYSSKLRISHRNFRFFSSINLSFHLQSCMLDLGTLRVHYSL